MARPIGALGKGKASDREVGVTAWLLANSAGTVGVRAAVEMLQSGQGALDAVERGIREVEADPTVRSVGIGGRPNLLGDIELDACIVDGDSLRAGAVGALQGFRHPISVARQVLERLPHALLVAEGAARFAREVGAEAGDLLTEDSRSDWQAWIEAQVPKTIRDRWSATTLVDWVRLTTDLEDPGDTVIFLAADRQRHLAAGGSTCGWAFKYPGRLGDSPIVGAGVYADSSFGAAGCTGVGELALRAASARSVVLYLKSGLSAADACGEAIRDLRRLERHHPGGLTIHAVDRDGNAHAITIGLPKPARYWFWREPDAEPERRFAALERW